MKRHRFYMEENLDREILRVMNPDLIHQWKNVLRFEIGEEIVLFNGSKDDYLFKLADISKKGADLEFIGREANVIRSEYAITLFVSPIKKDRFDWLLEKAGELGVSKIVPTICARTEIKDVNLTRARIILKEAIEQSGRGVMPKISEPLKFREVLESAEKNLFALHPKGANFSKDGIKEKTFGILIGPEGGFTDEEVGELREKNIPIYSMGPAIFRTETAVVAVLAQFLL